MTDIVVDLAERGRSLARNDSSRLVELLLEFLHEPPLSDVESAWDVEIARRVEADERGDETETFAAEAVFEEARCTAPGLLCASLGTPAPGCSLKRLTTKLKRRVLEPASGLK